ncbi:MAG: GFA family protein [Gammaproteobacteria bacterium]|nr:GFA family protein [Gammaproteobacteria bacterium]
MNEHFEALEGGCACGHVRYSMCSGPLIVHCCHCRWCQRQTGASFALNALYEADRVELLQGEVTELEVPSPSGKGQLIARCPKCMVAVWSNYYMGGLKERVRFIRVGTLDNPDRLPPDVHIFTSTKQPWVTLPPNDYAVEEFYDIASTYSPESLQRRDALTEAWKVERKRDFNPT